MRERAWLLASPFFAIAIVLGREPGLVTASFAGTMGIVIVAAVVGGFFVRAFSKESGGMAAALHIALVFVIAAAISFYAPPLIVRLIYR